ncbi:MAG: VTT domain-containing protein [Candidatus Falkowbacteria bacterium]|nr:VTT domain-containing protein [Candidatus Falkowbacteria bacterium]
MNSHDLTTLVPWVIAHGYLIFLIAATFEGPITTIAAGIAAALGYFNIFIIIALALAGDIGGDFIYYSIGYVSHNVIHSAFFRYLGLTEKRSERVAGLLHAHMRRAVLLIKLSPLVGPIGLMIIGSTRPKFKRFFLPALSLAIPKSLFFALLGYFSGQTYMRLNKVIAQGQYIILGIVIFIALIYFVYVRIISKITKELEGGN